MAIVQHITCNQLASSLVEINLSLFCERSELNELMDLTGKRVHIHEVREVEINNEWMHDPLNNLHPLTTHNSHQSVFSHIELKDGRNLNILDYEKIKKENADALNESCKIKPREVLNSISELEVE